MSRPRKLETFAQLIGAKPPRHVPRLLVRLTAGAAAATSVTKQPGACNARPGPYFSAPVRRPKARLSPKTRRQSAAPRDHRRHTPPRPTRLGYQTGTAMAGHGHRSRHLQLNVHTRLMFVRGWLYHHRQFQRRQ